MVLLYSTRNCTDGAIVFVRQAETDQSLIGRTSFMTPEEVLIRLRDRMLQHKKSIREAFLMFDQKNTGKISKRNFRQVCEQLDWVAVVQAPVHM